MHTVAIGHCACGRRAVLIDNRCGFCDAAAARPADVAHALTAPRPMTVAHAIDLLLAELMADDVPQPLAQRMTLACIAGDLCRLAGEEPPAAVLAALDEPTHAPVALPRQRITREPYREPA